MKLNATTEMLPITWPELGRLHPFAPPTQTQGYQSLFRDLENWLAEISGFAAVSLQPNAGSQGEYAGLLVIRQFHASRGEARRDVCLIPTSAHGTNPASAVMAGLKVVPVACDQKGNINVDDLTAKATEHRAQLAALIVNVELSRADYARPSHAASDDGRMRRQSAAPLANEDRNRLIGFLQSDGMAVLVVVRHGCRHHLRARQRAGSKQKREARKRADQAQAPGRRCPRHCLIPVPTERQS